MRWRSSDPVRWVRPLHSILCTFDGEIVPFEFAGVKSGRTTLGHRSCRKALSKRAASTITSRSCATRMWSWTPPSAKRPSCTKAKQKAFALGLELIEDEGLLEEVAGLAEWPVVLIGHIEDQFMDLPPEILQTSMRTHQKYFALRDAKTKQMANRFAVVSNMISADGGKQIVAGNERVLRARLSDAKFFWDQDRKVRLEARVAALKDIVFHAKVGTMQDRVDRVTFVAMVLTELLRVDFEKTKRAAWLAKADLTTGVVGEFPELQGVMGRYYALARP